MDSFWTVIHILLLFALLNWFFNRWTVAIVGIVVIGTFIEYSRFGKPPEERASRLLSTISGPIAYRGAAADAPENTLGMFYISLLTTGIHYVNDKIDIKYYNDTFML